MGFGEVEGTVIGGAADPLAERRIAAFHQHLANAADEQSVAPDLNGALLLLDDDQAPLLLRVGTWPPSDSAAVLGRGEYLKLNKESYCTWSSKSRVRSKSSSVSPGSRR